MFDKLRFKLFGKIAGKSDIKYEYQELEEYYALIAKDDWTVAECDRLLELTEKHKEEMPEEEYIKTVWLLTKYREEKAEKE